VPQLTTQLDEGSLAQPVKDFLGWLKVQLPNGEEGWARKDAFTPLYQSPK